MQEQGKISVTAENILPIIKKWLYSEHDIFIRELVSNAMDAITKHKHLSLMGEAPQKDVPYKIEIVTSDSEKTIRIRDNGVGMSAEEIKRYIAEVAFSGASEFVNKYKGASEAQQIIGHFGLGFYSSFMVADKVEVISKSFREDEPAVRFICDGTTSYTLETLEESREQGTEILLHINEESVNFLNDWELQTALVRHSGFLPVPISLNGKRINEQPAIWMSQPNTLKDEDYGKLFEHWFPMQEKPLFHIHFNLDTPFQLRGILWFPRIRRDFESFKGRIKLFCNQVFVSDNIEDIFPTYLFMLQGVIDCPDIPLNVSRSSLQGDPRVKKIGQHIAKKIADRLKEMARKEPEHYQEVWADIHPFVKFGILQDDKFAERVEDVVIFKTSHESGYTNLKDYLERAKEKHENKVFYASDMVSQASYLELYKSQGLEVLTLDDMIDTHFIQHLEMKGEGLTFTRIDSDLDQSFVDEDKKSKLVDQDNKTREDRLKEVFEKALGNDKITVRVENLKSDGVSGMILLPEHIRRFRDMNSLSQRVEPKFLEDHTFVINAQSPAMDKVLNLAGGMREEDATLVARHLYDLALLSQRALQPEKMNEFVERSNRIVNLLGAS